MKIFSVVMLSLAALAFIGVLVATVLNIYLLIVLGPTAYNRESHCMLCGARDAVKLWRDRRRFPRAIARLRVCRWNHVIPEGAWCHLCETDACGGARGRDFCDMAGHCDRHWSENKHS